MIGFIDYINATQYQISDFDLIIFYGCSGSGKSTQIRQMINSQWKHKEFSTISAAPIPWSDLFTKTINFKPLIKIDEIHHFREIHYLKKLLSQNHRLIVASHVHPGWFYLLRAKYKICTINLDLYPTKIAMYLQQRKLKFSTHAIEQYLRSYGPSFTEIDIILEHHQGNNFDQALSYFQKFNQITQNTTTRALKID